MTPQEMADLVQLRRARDRMDRDYAEPLDVMALASTACMSPSHFARKFLATFGETPYSYLMTRRIERAKVLLRHGASVTEACVEVGTRRLVRSVRASVRSLVKRRLSTRRETTANSKSCHHA